MKPTQQLHLRGQSLWYDNISRAMLDNGEIKRLIEEFGIRGMTSNPTIFDNAISKSTIYDSRIQQLGGRSSSEIFEELAIEDIARAADLLLPIYQSSDGTDGFVSIEVSPLLAADTAGTITEGKRLFSRLARKNVMIKVPGTPEGLPAIAALLEEGVSVNVTLLFGVENYAQVAETYCNSLRNRARRGFPVSEIRSVASFFVSRVDSVVDNALKELGDKGASYLGKFGIANCRAAYRRYQEIFEGPGFADLKAQNVAVQRPLWASTSTKNPAYRDVMYVEELIGNNTVNTAPHDTVIAFADHGIAKVDSILDGATQAVAMESELTSIGVPVKRLLHELQVDGVKKFTDSFTALMQSIEKKRG